MSRGGRWGRIEFAGRTWGKGRGDQWGEDKRRLVRGVCWEKKMVGQNENVWQLLFVRGWVKTQGVEGGKKEHDNKKRRERLARTPKGGFPSVRAGGRRRRQRQPKEELGIRWNVDARGKGKRERKGVQKRVGGHKRKNGGSQGLDLNQR